MENFEPKIVAFLCNWCSYTGADLAGTSRMEYPANVRTVRVMCSGRVNPMLIVNAFQQGADGVLISGCHPGDCHYTHGNYFARRRFQIMRRILEFIGIHPDRVRMSWVSAAEGKKFTTVINEVVEDIRKLGPADQIGRRNHTINRVAE